MITLSYTQSLPNRMFQYAFGRILAERFGYRLKAHPLSLFPGSRQCVSGEEVFSPKVHWFGNWPIGEEFRPVTGEELYTPPVARLCLRGAFQRFELFAESRDSIREDWFRIDAGPLRPSSDFAISLDAPVNPKEGAQPLTAHVTDPKAAAGLLRDSFLTAEEVRRLAKSVPHKNLFIVVGCLVPAWVKTDLEDLRPTFVSAGEYGNFLFLLRFQKLGIGQSAAHWWAAFLSQAREIYFPPCDRGCWLHPAPPLLAHEPAYHGIDLRVDEPRFVYSW